MTAILKGKSTDGMPLLNAHGAGFGPFLPASIPRCALLAEMEPT